MLQLFSFTLPTILIIIAGYLIVYRNSLKAAFNIESGRIIYLFAFTSCMLSILGFILNFFQLRTFVYLWMVAAVIFISVMIQAFIQLGKGE